VKPAAGEERPAVESEPPVEPVLPSTLASGCSPGIDGPPVSSAIGRTGRPVGGAKPKGADATFGVAEAAVAGDESDPGRPTLKPIVEPATTASRSQQTVRTGTF
jgi:hypothetical protein